MQFIMDFIDWFVTTVETVWDFFMSIIDNTILLLKYLGIAANMCYVAIATLPTWLQSFAFITITISILYLVLGRQTGGKS